MAKVVSWKGPVVSFFDSPLVTLEVEVRLVVGSRWRGGV